MTHYDIIGDIHGHADRLEALLQKMGYARINGFYQHPGHQVIFLGDFIDRGQYQRETIALVHPMVESGTARAVMGNHEFNAICYATPDENGDPIKEHSEKNRHRHKAFLDAYPPGSDDYNDVIDWFKTLPLYLKLDDIDIIHACMDDDSIAALTPFLNPDNTLTHEALMAYSREETPCHDALETLLKGPEHTLPDGILYSDPQGNTRKVARVRWWIDDTRPTSTRLGFSDGNLPADQLRTLDAVALSHRFNKAARPVFFGHYWLENEPAPMGEKAACLDYSVAENGKLVAYRWSGETTIQPQHYIW